MNFSRLVVDTAVAMLKPEIPVASRKSAPKITNSWGTVGNPRMRNVVKSSGDMYIIPLSPPASNLPMANSRRVIGRLSM